VVVEILFYRSGAGCRPATFTPPKVDSKLKLTLTPTEEAGNIKMPPEPYLFEERWVVHQEEIYNEVILRWNGQKFFQKFFGGQFPSPQDSIDHLRSRSSRIKTPLHWLNIAHYYDELIRVSGKSSADAKRTMCLEDVAAKDMASSIRALSKWIKLKYQMRYLV
jgi:hypothetical protein